MLNYIHQYIYYYLAIVNILSLALMIYDKYISRFNNVKFRIPEKTLLMMSAIGGAGGTLLGMIFFRHKTKHNNFKSIVPVFFVIWLFICLYIYYNI